MKNYISYRQKLSSIENSCASKFKLFISRSLKIITNNNNNDRYNNIQSNNKIIPKTDISSNNKY